MNSERLEQLLTERASAAARKEVLALVTQCSMVEHAEFLEVLETRWSPLAACETVSKCEFADQAVSRIKFDASKSEITEWAVRFLQAMLVENQCLLFIGGYGLLPWLRLTFRDGVEGLAELWRLIKCKEILVADLRQSRCRIITEEEYECLAFELA